MILNTLLFKKHFSIFLIFFSFFASMQSMDQSFNRYENNEYSVEEPDDQDETTAIMQIQTRADLSSPLSFFEHKKVDIVSDQTNNIEVSFDCPSQGNVITTYCLNDESVGQLTETDILTSFQQLGLNIYTYVFKSKVEKDRFQINISDKNSMRLEAPVDVQDLTIFAHACFIQSDIKSDAFSFTGNRCNILAPGSFKVKHATFPHLKSFFNDTQIEFEQDLVIDSDTLSNYGQLKAKNCSFIAKKLLNKGLIIIDESLTSECTEIINNKKIKIGQNWIVPYVETLTMGKASEIIIGHDWQVQADAIIFDGIVNIDHQGLFIAEGDVQCKQFLRAPIIEIISKSDISCETESGLYSDQSLKLKAYKDIYFLGTAGASDIGKKNSPDDWQLTGFKEDQVGAIQGPAKIILFYSHQGDIYNKGRINGNNRKICMLAPRGTVYVSNYIYAGYDEKAQVEIGGRHVLLDKKSWVNGWTTKIKGTEQVDLHGMVWTDEECLVKGDTIHQTGKVYDSTLCAMKGRHITIEESAWHKASDVYLDGSESVEHEGLAQTDKLFVKSKNVKFGQGSHIQSHDLGVQAEHAQFHGTMSVDRFTQIMHEIGDIFSDDVAVRAAHPRQNQQIARRKTKLRYNSFSPHNSYQPEYSQKAQASSSSRSIPPVTTNSVLEDHVEIQAPPVVDEPIDDTVALQPQTSRWLEFGTFLTISGALGGVYAYWSPYLRNLFTRFYNSTQLDLETAEDQASCFSDVASDDQDDPSTLGDLVQDAAYDADADDKENYDHE